MWHADIKGVTKSLRGVLLLFIDSTAGAYGPKYARNVEYFTNPGIDSVKCSVEGTPCQIYPQNMLPWHMWSEIQKEFAPVATDAETYLTAEQYYENKFGFWLDMRSHPNHNLHGSGLLMEKPAAGVKIHFEKDTPLDRDLVCYVYVLTDAQVHIQGGRFIGHMN
jgi:hypothetical protein